jgi:hypothetical protein
MIIVTSRGDVTYTGQLNRPEEEEGGEGEENTEGGQGGNGSQPSPTDDGSGGLGFLDSDPGMWFIAWASGQRIGSPLRPTPDRDDPGGTVAQTGQASVTRSVGLEAVINPTDPLWGSGSGSGGGGEPLPRGCVVPWGPPRM